MKKIAFSIFLFLMCGAVSAQTNVQIDSTKVLVKGTQSFDYLAFEYTEVVYLNISKAELWNNLKSWVAKSFASKFVIDDEDKESGRMIISYSKDVNSLGRAVDGVLHSSLRVDVRDGRYRVHFYNQNIVIRVSDRVDYSYLPTSALKSMKEELLAVEAIAKRYFNGSLTWYPNQITNSWSEFSSASSSLMIDYRLHSLNREVMDSLNESMKIKDDF